MPERRAVRSLPLMKLDVGMGVGSPAVVTVTPVTVMSENVESTPRVAAAVWIAEASAPELAAADSVAVTDAVTVAASAVDEMVMPNVMVHDFESRLRRRPQSTMLSQTMAETSIPSTLARPVIIAVASSEVPSVPTVETHMGERRHRARVSAGGDKMCGRPHV